MLPLRNFVPANIPNYRNLIVAERLYRLEPFAAALHTPYRVYFVAKKFDRIGETDMGGMS